MADRIRGAQRRHPTGGGYARGEQKRTRIIESAIEVFGAQGYDAATTRSLAEHAQVPPTALQYYFGGKEGLYAACDAYIAEMASGRLYAVLLDVNESLASGGCSPSEMRRVADRLTDGLVDFIFGSSQTESWVLFVVRSEIANSPQSKAAQFKRRVVEALRNLIAHANSGKLDETAVTIRALAIYGTLISFRLAQGLVLRSLGWDGFGPRRLPILREELKRIVRSMLKMSPSTAS